MTHSIGAPRGLSQEGSHILSLSLVGGSAHTPAQLSSSGAEVKIALGRYHVSVAGPVSGRGRLAVDQQAAGFGQRYPSDSTT